MPLGPTDPITAGHYRNLSTGEVFFACNCGGTPQHRTLRFIATQRHNYEKVSPAELKKRTQNVVA